MPRAPTLWECVPDAVRAVVETLARAGHEPVLVGGCVRDLLRGAPVHDWDVASAAEPEAVLALFPRAVPIGLRFGTVMVPTRAGPVDVTRFRVPGGGVRADLAHRDFTVNAMAIAPGTDTPLDPFDGQADLAAGRLRAVGVAAERLAEDPLRALRAARLGAELGLAADDGLRAALPGAARGLDTVSPERIRSELERLLVAPGAARGLRLLRETGLESVLLPGARADAAAVVAILRADLPLRLAAWLRDTDAARRLARWRSSRERTREVTALLAHHPIEEHAGRGPAGLRRLAGRVGEAGLERLLALRRAECAVGSADAAVAARLEALAATLARLRRAGTLDLGRTNLALDGREVMALLGCPPGPRVGRALHHLTECVLDDPSRNEPDTLRRLLREWARREPSQAGSP